MKIIWKVKNTLLTTSVKRVFFYNQQENFKMLSANVNNAMQTNSLWTGDAQDFFVRQHNDHMQKYRWHKFTSQFKEISTDELLREAGLRK